MIIYKILQSTFKGFIKDNCYLHAAALTFYFLLSLVPLLAVSFGIAQMIALETLLKTFIMERFHDYEEFTKQMIDFSYSYLEQARGGWIAAVFAIFYFWIVLTLFASLENTFNIIWGVKKGRPIWKRLVLYLVLTLVTPVFAIASSSISIYLTQMLAEYQQLTPLAALFWNTIPFFASWILFTLLYQFLPFAQVSWKASILSAFITGSFYQIIQWAFIYFQFGVHQYGAIFGSFSAFPLFLLWLQVSWILLLFGAELNFSMQKIQDSSIM